MVIICPPRISSFPVMVGLTDILRREGQMVGDLDVESSIPTRLLKPRKSILHRTSEITPVRLEGEMHRQRSLRNPIVHLCPRTQHRRIRTGLYLPRSHDPLPVGKCKVSDLMREGHLRNEPPLESRRRVGCQVHLVLQLQPRLHLV